jgi:pilus assembly protein CpaF
MTTLSTERVSAVTEEVRKHLERRGVPIPGWQAPARERDTFRFAVAEALVHCNVPDADVTRLAEQIATRLSGLDMLQPLLEEPGVEEIIIRNGHLLVEKEGLVEARGRLADDAAFETLARTTADTRKQAMWGGRSFVLVDLPDGSRFTAMVPPLSVAGTAINIRVHRQDALRLGDLAAHGTFDASPDAFERDEGAEAELVDALGNEGIASPAPPAVAALASIVREGLASVLVSGEFSAGKTTLLGALMRLIPTTSVLAVAETFRELKVAHPYAARAVVRQVLDKGAGNQGPTMREVVNVLYTRMRPDVIVFGEVVGDEAVPLLDAMNLGKRVLTTIHGDSAYGALLRLEMLALASGLPLSAVRERVARGINLVVHMARNGRRRYVAEVAAVTGYDHAKNSYRMESLYRAGEAFEGERSRAIVRRWQALCP